MCKNELKFAKSDRKFAESRAFWAEIDKNSPLFKSQQYVKVGDMGKAYHRFHRESGEFLLDSD